MALLAMVARRVRNGQTLIAQTGTRRKLRRRKGALNDFSGMGREPAPLGRIADGAGQAERHVMALG